MCQMSCYYHQSNRLALIPLLQWWAFYMRERILVIPSEHWEAKPWLGSWDHGKVEWSTHTPHPATNQLCDLFPQMRINRKLWLPIFFLIGKDKDQMEWVISKYCSKYEFQSNGIVYEFYKPFPSAGRNKYFHCWLKRLPLNIWNKQTNK